MLNVPTLSKSVKMISDTRHHHKRPLYFNIPKFVSSKEQLQISELSKVSSKIVENYINNHERIKESELNEYIKDNINQIQDLGINILKSKEGEEVIKEYLYK